MYNSKAHFHFNLKVYSESGRASISIWVDQG